MVSPQTSVLSELAVLPGRAFIETIKNFTGRYIDGCGREREPIPRGEETAITPDEPDVLDGGDVVEGVGSWRQVVE